MELSYIYEFVLLAEIKNFSDAADELAVSESTLSRHIKALEAELGVTLFDRTSRTMKINEYGEIALPYAKQMISLDHGLKRDLGEAKVKQKGTVVVSSIYFITDMVTRFYQQNSDTFIRVNFADLPEEAFEMLRLGESELAFVTDLPEDSTDYIVYPYETDTYVAVLPPSHPMAKRKSLALAELAQEDFISFKTDTYPDLCVKNLCRQAGFEPRIVFNADVGSTIAAMVNQSLGVSILQKKTLAKMGPQDVAMVDLSPEAKFEVSLCYRRDAKLSAGAKKLVNFVNNKWPSLKPGEGFRG